MISDPNAGGAVVVEIEGKPVAKQRPGRNRGRYFTKPETADFQTALAWQAKRAMRGRKIFAGAVSFSVSVELEIPLSWNGTKQAAARRGEIYPTSRPDFDNYEKIAADALNGIVFNDDAQVCFGMFSKRYGDRPHMRIEISEIGATA